MESSENSEKEDSEIESLKQDRIEELIEKKVEEKTQKLEKQNQELENKIEKLKTNSNKPTNPNNPQNQGISRRQFLKKAGLGTAGLAALMSPVSALNIRDSQGLKVYNNDTKYFDVANGGPVQVKNTELKVKGNTVLHEGNTGGAVVENVVTDYSSLPDPASSREIAYVTVKTT